MEWRDKEILSERDLQQLEDYLVQRRACTAAGLGRSAPIRWNRSVSRKPRRAGEVRPNSGDGQSRDRRVLDMRKSQRSPGRSSKESTRENT
jgi:hypothetical protein